MEGEAEGGACGEEVGARVDVGGDVVGGLGGEEGEEGEVRVGRGGVGGVAGELGGAPRFELGVGGGEVGCECRCCGGCVCVGCWGGVGVGGCGYGC